MAFSGRRDAETQRRRDTIRMLLLSSLCLCASVLSALISIDIAQADDISFKGDIAPLLLSNCLACHGPKKSEGGYRIDTFERVTAAGDSTQPGFVKKDLEGSEAFRRITSTDVKERMPLEGDPLPPELPRRDLPRPRTRKPSTKTGPASSKLGRTGRTEDQE